MTEPQEIYERDAAESGKQDGSTFKLQEALVSEEEKSKITKDDASNWLADRADDYAVPFLKKEPVITALLLANLPIVAATIGTFATSSVAWIRVVSLVALIVVNAAGIVARQAVTPVALPKSEEGRKLIEA